jgi:hypothetical protein
MNNNKSIAIQLMPLLCIAITPVMYYLGSNAWALGCWFFGVITYLVCFNKNNDDSIS